MLLRRGWFPFLGWSVIGSVLIFIALHVVNAVRLDALELRKSAQTLVERAEEVTRRASPDYQDVALAALPPNPNVGDFYRFDDNLKDATVVQKPADARPTNDSEFQFRVEFEGTEEERIVAANGNSGLTMRDGLLIVSHHDGDYLTTDKPLSIPFAGMSDIILRARADRGNRFQIGWAAEGRESSLRRNQLNLDLIADGEFHTYIVNAENAFRNGVDVGENISVLAITPSNVDGAIVEIDFVRIVSKQWKYQMAQKGISHEAIDGELRPVIHMVPTQKLSYTVDIPTKNPELSFGAASLFNKLPLELSINIDTGADSKLIFRTMNVDAEAWHDEILDLSPWAGQTVQVEFDVRGSGDNVAFWSNPMIRSAAKRRFNVILILEDALRADHLSTQGYTRPTAPAKTRLMSQHGVVFLNAHSQATKTRMSIPTLMTSLYATATGVWSYADALNESYLTMAEIFRAQGFVTASFIQNGNAGPYAGAHQGFSSLREEDTIGTTTEDVFGNRMSDWLDKNGDRNFFLYVHAVDPHGPYDPPQPFDSWYRQAPAEAVVAERRLPKAQAIDPRWAETPSGDARRLLYDGEILHNDAVIDTFIADLKERNLLDDTLLVFVSDHGEWMGELGLWEHHPPGNRPAIHVPFMLSYPKLIDAPKRIEESVQLIDVMPTILEFASVDSADFLMHGDSLVSLIQGSDTERWKKRLTVSEEPMIMDKDDPCACGSMFFDQWQLHGSTTGWPGRVNSEFVKTAVYRFREDGITPVTSYLPDLYIRLLRNSTLSSLTATNIATWRKFTEGQQQDAYKMDPATLQRLRGLGYVN